MIVSRGGGRIGGASAAGLAACVLIAAPLAAPIAAKEALGVFSSWAAFRDDAPARCYAIAKPRRERDTDPFASVATWPERGIRGQVHLRLSRPVREGASVGLIVGQRRFALTANAHNAWAPDAREDAAIIAAMRSASAMRVSARDRSGVRFTDRYDLAGAATAIDAATVGCIARRGG